MVSLRRRRLLGLSLCAGSSVVSPLPQILADGTTLLHTRSATPYTTATEDVKQLEDKSTAVGEAVAANAPTSSSPEEQKLQPYPGYPIKRRKQYRRKHVQNQEPCLMRGVYFKNMKWQAAIKVDKKQIHLGTFSTQEEAARLYDRAAFMCGRETNFEISEETKQELSRLKWDEFLAMTRNAINNKKHKRKTVTVSRKRPEPPLQNGDLEVANMLSESEDDEPALRNGDFDSKKGVNTSPESKDEELDSLAFLE